MQRSCANLYLLKYVNLITLSTALTSAPAFINISSISFEAFSHTAIAKIVTCNNQCSKYYYIFNFRILVFALNPAFDTAISLEELQVVLFNSFNNIRQCNLFNFGILIVAN